MIEQVSNGQWMFSGVRTFLTGLHFLPLEFWNVLLHQIIELQMPFIDHHHDGDRDERFGDRGGPKNIGGLHPFLVHDPPADRIDGRDLPIASHQGDHAGTLAVVYDGLKVFGDLR
ncbi:hypothetical protein OAJ79_03235 [Verrucomicrobia bacterium]|nr:hypothetical protein [Verrucomicrobiota bacterium]